MEDSELKQNDKHKCHYHHRKNLKSHFVDKIIGKQVAAEISNSHFYSLKSKIVLWNKTCWIQNVARISKPLKQAALLFLDFRILNIGFLMLPEKLPRFKIVSQIRFCMDPLLTEFCKRVFISGDFNL